MCSSLSWDAPCHWFLTLINPSWTCRILPAPLTAQTLTEHHNMYPCKEAAPSGFFHGRALASFPTCLLKFSAPPGIITHPVPVSADAAAVFHWLHPPQAQGRFIPPTPASTALFLPRNPLAPRPRMLAWHLRAPSPWQPSGTAALPTVHPLPPWMLTSLQPHTTPPSAPSYPLQISPGHNSRLLISPTLWHTVMNKAPLGDLRK